MRRTQLYLTDELWKVLHIRSRQHGTTISDLVRQALRDKYGSASASRRQAMQAFVGLWRNRHDLRDSEAYVRRLRKGQRLGRIAS